MFEGFGLWSASWAEEVEVIWEFPKIRGTYYNGESNGKENGK